MSEPADKVHPRLFGLFNDGMGWRGSFGPAPAHHGWENVTAGQASEEMKAQHWHRWPHDHLKLVDPDGNLVWWQDGVESEPRWG